MTHTGTEDYAIDFGLSYQPVGAIARGVVYAASFDSVGGNYMIIDHQNGYYSYYGHLSSFNKSVNQAVREGDVIATSGNSPGNVGPHLHFSIKSGGPWGTAVKPEPMGGINSPSETFGDFGYSTLVGCQYNRDPGGWNATAPALAVTQTSGSGAYYLDAYGGINSVYAPTLTASDGASWPGWNIARDFKLCPLDSTKGYLLDGYGGIHPVGSPPPPSVPSGDFSYWPGWDIARSIAIEPDCQSGYTMDGWGGLHPFAANGALPPQIPNGSHYWPGQDIAKAMVLEAPSPSNPGSGYVLDYWGGIHEFGSAPAITGFAYWPGWDIARGIVLTVDVPCCSGYTLDGWGGIHAFGPNATSALKLTTTGQASTWHVESRWLVSG